MYLIKKLKIKWKLKGKKVNNLEKIRKLQIFQKFMIVNFLKHNKISLLFSNKLIIVKIKNYLNLRNKSYKM